MAQVEKVLGQVSDLVWGPPLLILLFGTHLFLTFRLRLVQRYLGTAIRISLETSSEGRGDVSQFRTSRVSAAPPSPRRADRPERCHRR
jgi:AGCS family alanine or glycine:cation symporter